MEVTSNSSFSVYNLISNLAALQLKDECWQSEQTAAAAASLSPSASATALAKRRTQIYEALLCGKESASLTEEEDAECPRLEQLPLCQKLLDEQRCFLDAKMRNDITRCLLNMCKSQESIKSEDLLKSKEDEENGNLELLQPLPLSLRESTGQFSATRFLTLPAPKRLKSMKEMRSTLQPLDISRKSNFVSFDIESLRNGCQSKQQNTALHTNLLGGSLARLKESNRALKRIEHNVPIAVPINNKTELSIAEISTKKCVGPEKYFLSDINVSNELRVYLDKSLQLSYLELPHLIDHLKKASAGLQSETFLWTAGGQFRVRPNTTARPLLPANLAEYARPFLASGKAFRSLSARTEWRYAEYRIEGPMNRTMRRAIITFLANCRLYLLCQCASNLSQLVVSAMPTMQLLQQLEKQLLEAENNINISTGKNSGSLLSFVWSAIDDCMTIEYLQLLVYFLRSLCETYFCQLQRWLYEGELDEPFDELFVGYCGPKWMQEASKECIDKGFHVRHEILPGFLMGCEEAIMRCGRYNRLLRTYNDQHKIFRLKPPDLVVCLSEEQLTEMRRKLNMHYNRVLAHFKPFRMSTVIDESAASSKRYGNRMWKCTQEHIAAFERNQYQSQLKANEIKKRLYEDLNEQQAADAQKRLERQRGEIVQELSYQRECEQLEEERLEQFRRELAWEINELKKAALLKELTVAVNSPDESSSSCPSFVSCCEEQELEHEPEPIPITEEMTSEMARNRMRNMSSEQFAESQTWVHHRQSSSAPITTKPKEYSEAECNRLRVLGCTQEFQRDMNMNVGALTDMHRNRERMMHHSIAYLSTASEKSNATVNREIYSNTELARNQRHVMQAEYGIRIPLPEEKEMPLEATTSLEAPTPLEALTPLDATTPLAEPTPLATTAALIRERIMKHATVNRDIYSNTELARNRRHVMQAEYGIRIPLPEEKETPLEATTSLAEATPLAPPTPLATTAALIRERIMKRATVNREKETHLEATTSLEAPTSLEALTPLAEPTPLAVPTPLATTAALIRERIMKHATVNREIYSNTELARNQRHVMQTEYGIKIPLLEDRETSLEVPAPRVASPSLATTGSRNREHMMEHNIAYLSSKADGPHPTRNREIYSNTELARNQRHVMQAEYGIKIALPEAKETPVAATTPLGATASRNRERMMKHDIAYLSTPADAPHATVNREIYSNTELARNRRHVMQAEYGIKIPLPEEKELPVLATKPLEVITPLEATTGGGAMTPMSTTSDGDLDLMLSNEVIDAANNNISCEITEDNTDDDRLYPIITGKTQLSEIQPERKPRFSFLQLHKKEAVHSKPYDGNNPYMIKRYLQQSIMVPLNAHLSVLENEVLRIFQDLKVYQHFQQLRNYYFLLDGQFGTLLVAGILEHIDAGLEPRSLCQKGILDSILNNALTNRIGQADNSLLLIDTLTLTWTKVPENFDLMDIDLLSIFNLECHLDWPLNLILSPESMAKYMQISSYLLKLRHVNFVLDLAYQSFQEEAKVHGRLLQSSQQYRHLQIIRHKLLHFVITLQNYVDANALQGTWQCFNEELRTVDSFEKLYHGHVEYLKKVAFLCLLNRKSTMFREAIETLLVIVMRFCKILRSQAFVLDDNQQYSHPRYKRLLFEETEFDKFMRYILYLGNKVAVSGYQEKIKEFMCVLNFNNYYNVSNSTS